MTIEVTQNGDVNVVQSNAPYFYFTWINYNNVNSIGVDMKAVTNGLTETISNIYAATTQEECINFALTLGIELTPII